MESIYNLPVEEHGKGLFDTSRPFPFQRYMEQTVDRREFLHKKLNFMLKNPFVLPMILFFTWADVN